MRVVALRALGLGDLLTAVPALRALREQEAPGGSCSTVAVAAPRVLAPLVELAGCEHVEAEPLGPLPAAAHGADLLVNLHGSGPQSHRVALAAAPRRLVAFAHPDVPESAGMPVWDPEEHEVARWCRLLRESGIPADPARLELPDPQRPPAGEDLTGATVVHPGAASAARRWPAERFAEVARAEARAGRRVVLTGSASERPLALEVAHRARLPERAVLAGRTDVLELATVVARAGRVVCGDTGVAHLATAFATPSVLLFGPTSPETWGPPMNRKPQRLSIHRVLWAGTTGDPHGAAPDPGLLTIAPADVLGELALLPARTQTMATAAALDTITILDPSTGEEVGSIPAGDAATVDAAVTAARAAQPAWAARPAGERAAALKRVAASITAHADELAALNARESGKLLGDARGGAEAGAGAVEQYAELAPLHRGRALQGDPLAHDAMRFAPRGVVAVIVPWNDPIAIAAQGLGAALAVGNAIVFKPSERAPFCCARLFELFAGELPEGVVQLVQGDARAGAPLAAHPGVDVVLHTGSVTTGRAIARACAERGAKAILELGGNDAVIVDEDVDPAWAAGQVASGAWVNAGQVCVSTERVLVHERIAEPFLAALTERAQALAVGPADDPATQMGPLVDTRHRDAVDVQVSAALDAGARALTGGAPLDGPGAFYPPTVLVDVTPEMAVVGEETFGPVVPVQVVASFDEAIAQANATAYGLAATALTCSQEHAARALAELHAGTVKVNNVWGGAPGGAAHPRGVSGQGLGYGPELLDELTVVKVVHAEPGVPRA